METPPNLNVPSSTQEPDEAQSGVIDTSAERCPHCGQPWADHEFGVPAPYCP